MGRPSNRAERRADIRKALLRVMATTGYERATIAQIAAEASLAPGLVHYHYKNKQEILLDLIERMHVFRTKSLVRIDQLAAQDPLAALDEFIDLYLALENSDPQARAAWTAMGTEALRSDDVRDRFEALLSGAAKTLRRIVDHGIARGEFSGRDRDAIVAALVALVQGYLFVSATTVKLIPKGSAAKTAKSAARGLLHADPT